MDQNLSDLLSRDSDLPDNMNYLRRGLKKKEKYRKRKKHDPIKFCANFKTKLPTTAYKSKVLQLNLNVDPLHHRIYFLTFIESLDMIFTIKGKLYDICR